MLETGHPRLDLPLALVWPETIIFPLPGVCALCFSVVVEAADTTKPPQGAWPGNHMNIFVS